MRITVSQQPVKLDPYENLETTIKVFEETDNTDWLVTPEGSVSGYLMPPALINMDPKNVHRLQDVLSKVEQAKSSYNFNLALGTAWVEQDNLPYNQVRFYDRNNHFLGSYSKQILCETSEGGGEIYNYFPGRKNVTFEHEGTTFGSLICNDFWATPRVSPNGNPYHVKELAQAGAQVIFVPVNCNNKDFDELQYKWHTTHLEFLAREYGVYIAVSNNSCDFDGNEVSKVLCPSGVISPDGKWIAQCNQSGSDLLTVEINLKNRIPIFEENSNRAYTTQ